MPEITGPRRRFGRQSWLRPLLVLLILAMAVAGQLLPANTGAPDYSAILAPPSWSHFLGTDSLGRDVLARVLRGAPTSVAVGLIVALVSAVLGIVGGALAGYFGGWIDALISRVIDYFLTVPPFFFVLVAVAVLGASLFNSSLIIGIALSATTARQVRVQFLTLREREFVAAARLMGMSAAGIMFLEILPNAIQPAVVQSTLNAASGVLIQAGLSFLGLGDPNITEWGSMISENFANGLSGWWAIIAPGVAVTLLVVGLMSLGDQLNRRFDAARQY